MHCLFYLAGISLRIASPEQAASSFSAVMPKQWWDLMRNAWHIFYFFIPKGMDDRIGRLSDRVVDMRYPLPNPSKDNLEEVDDDLIESIPALVVGHEVAHATRCFEE
ncbi:uncharacterized protein EDB93DRAFT_1252940 [Suillus bovinus]|uniref:uncharacterized protein n=1 Tax=Suillus bovinus TaxID=48563 RepID=UPI001B87233F|nr:uncharacterized protein EDB93DRAFT_1252940 [Suillus bovinus]KAG2139817.1 hypothetical protein EDB93DRAFT_1252940 [Suillus bovinus]